MLRIEKIKIENFRSCKTTELILEEFTPLVGYNNAGKSNILRAIEAFARCKGLTESEFNDPHKPLIITCLISGFNDEVMKNLNPKQKTELERFFDESGKSWIRFYQEKPGTGKNIFSLEAKLPLLEENWSCVSSLSQIITTLFPEPTFVRSMEDAAEDVAKIKASNTVGKLISILEKEILKTRTREIEEALDEVSRKLNIDGNQRFEELSKFDEEISCKVEDFFPGIRLSLDIPTPKVSDLFKAGSLKITEGDSENRQQEFSDMGHGAQRAIQMTLIRHLAEISQSPQQEGITNLLLIDEPELFLHPQAIEKIRSSLRTLSKAGYQVIFSTHSPFMIGQEDIVNTNIVRKDGDGTHVKLRLSEALNQAIEDHDAQARVLFDIFNLSQILFSDKVLIAEGETERQVLPSLFHAFSGKTHGEAKLAIIIGQGSGNLVGMRKILDLMGIPCLMLVDLDYAFREAQKNKFLDEDDSDIKSCLNILKKIKDTHGFKLDDKGHPTKNDSFRAPDVYEILARENEAKQYIFNLHKSLKKHQIWLWQLGAIEPHLCLKSKKSRAWYLFKEKLTKEPCHEVVEDANCINLLIRWIEQNS